MDRPGGTAPALFYDELVERELGRVFNLRTTQDAILCQAADATLR
jgi:hypothetical protein